MSVVNGGEWESTHGFSILYVPVGVFAAGELLLALILWRTVFRGKKAAGKEAAGKEEKNVQ